MKWFKGAAVVLGVLIGILTILPFFISVDSYRTTIEKEASARLKEPVTITSLRVSLLPVPHVNIDGISIGKIGDVTLGAVKLVPDVWSLTSATKVIKNLEIDGVVLTQKGMDKIPLWMKSDKPPSAQSQVAPVRVQYVR